MVKNMLLQKILNKEAGILTYGMTPPKAGYTAEKIVEISQKQVDRIKALEIDALLLYDVQEEAERVEQERPFPYLQTIDPAIFCDQYLSGLPVPKIIYRSVGNYSREQFIGWLKDDASRDRFSVYVGASSSK